MVIFSPYLNSKRVGLFLSLESIKKALRRGVRIVTVARPSGGERSQ